MGWNDKGLATVEVAPVATLVRREVAPLEFTPEQQQLIRDTFANGATNAEFAVLMEVARARRLNPLLRQIFFVKRYDKMKAREVWSTQISIDGLRAVAERTGLYAGQDEPEYVYDEKGKLRCCKVRIYRKDWPRPAVGVAYWAEYVQTTRGGEVTQFWNRMPHVMLAKCAESLGFRKAFPEDTAGLYTPEEMGDVPIPQIRQEAVARPAPAIEAPRADALTDEIARVRGNASAPAEHIVAVVQHAKERFAEVMAARPEAQRAAEEHSAAVEEPPMTPLDELREQLLSVETRESLRTVWHELRAAIQNMDAEGAALVEARRLMWECAESQGLARTKKELAEILGAKPQPPPDGPTGGKRAPANDAPVDDDAAERAAIEAEARDAAQAKARAQRDALKAYVDGKANRYEIEHGLAKHRREYALLDDWAIMHVVVPRLVELGMGEGVAVNVVRVALNNARGRRAA